MVDKGFGGKQYQKTTDFESQKGLGVKHAYIYTNINNVLQLYAKGQHKHRKVL